MGQLFAYSLGISLPIILMFVIYKCLLSRKTFYRFNRMVLLSIYIVALILIPCAFLATSFMRSNNGVVAVEVGNVVTTFMENADKVETSDVPVLSLLLGIYMTGVLMMILKLFIAFGRILWLVMSSEKVCDNNYVIVLHDHAGYVPFSWGHWIFMSKTDYLECGKFVVAHERSHLDARHWVDLLIAEVVICINWFNPATWLMRAELQDLHEYEADSNVLETHLVDNEEYQMFLIKKTAGARFAAIANSLNHSSLKKRITMMLSKESNGKARFRAFALVPAAALAMVFVNNQVVASTLSSVAATSVIAVSPDKDSEKSPLNAAEKMPQFPGGETALMKFIAENVVYPEAARKEGGSGVVVVQFVVSETGKVTNPKIMRGISESLNAEALRVIGILPDFIPGEVNGKKVAVKYTLPIAFQKESTGEMKQSATTPQSTGKSALTEAEKMPRFPGGQGALMNYIAKNINYPQSSKDKNEQGIVVVRFIVTETGKVSEPEVVKSVSPALDAEAVRVISSLPDFIPGRVGGKAVAVKYTLPITFKL